MIKCKPARRPPALSEKRHQAHVFGNYAQTWIIKALHALPECEHKNFAAAAELIKDELERLAPGGKPERENPLEKSNDRRNKR